MPTPLTLVDEAMGRDAACGLCGGSGLRVLLSVRSDEGTVTVVRCETCALEFVSPLPSEQQLEARYDARYFQEGYLRYASERIAESERRVQVITRVAPRGKLLDVGCGVGFFLKALSDRQWEGEGLEPSAFAAEYARTTYGLRVLTGTLPDVRFDPESYDVITMFDVIGHLRDPRAYLIALRRLLKKTGTLVIQVPNFQSPWHRFNWLSYRAWRVNRLHVPSIIWRFRLPTLARLLAETGYEVVRVERAASLGLGLGRRLGVVRWAADAVGTVIRSPNEFLVYAKRQ